MTDQTFAAFVPMKGHSERVPNKNIRPLAGKPLYRWVVDALRGVDAVSTILIDTDSERIAEDVQATYGDEVRIAWRPEELRGDFTPMHDILAHDASLVDEELLLQSHSTNPLLRSATIAAAIDAWLAKRDEHDSLFTVTPLQTRFYWADGRPLNHDPAVLQRTQDLDPIYEENSNLYLFSKQVIEATGLRMGTTPMLFPMDAAEAVDIDEELDFTIADLLAHHRLEQEG
jgi:CMP-N-acetylneuraminic acid synthetase